MSIVHWFSGAIIFLGAVAIFSRLVTAKGTYKTIDNALASVTNLFNGAYFS
jgi:hypothetical protein